MEWSQLETRGFVISPGFLKAEELSTLIDTYRKGEARQRYGFMLINVDDPLVRYFQPRLDEISARIRASTELAVDCPAFGSFVEIEQGVERGWQDWHQDAITWYLGQDNYHYVNVYLPLLKPRPELSNMHLVPFDRLERECSPGLREQLKGGGARRARIIAGHTQLFDDQYGGYDEIPCDLNELAVTPHLAAGDLLVMRGDLFHKTQDVLTDRVAVSFRLAWSNTDIWRRRLGELCLSKLITLATRNGTMSAIYLRAFEVFDNDRHGRDVMGAREFNEAHARLLAERPCQVSGDEVLQQMAVEMKRDPLLFSQNLARLVSDLRHLIHLAPTDPAVAELQRGLALASEFTGSRQSDTLAAALRAMLNAQDIIERLPAEVAPYAPRVPDITLS